MKKATSILAVMVFSLSLLSCETESTTDTDALYEINASDGDSVQTDTRDTED